VFEELLAGNINLGRPEHVEVIFGSKVTRSTPGTFSTRLLNRGDQVTINLSFRHSVSSLPGIAGWEAWLPRRGRRSVG
jgi:hypothetical protein